MVELSLLSSSSLFLLAAPPDTISAIISLPAHNQ